MKHAGKKEGNNSRTKSMKKPTSPIKSYDLVYLTTRVYTSVESMTAYQDEKDESS